MSVDVSPVRYSDSDHRTCFHCTETVVSEVHVLINCPVYEDLTHKLCDSISKDVPNFDNLSNDHEAVCDSQLQECRVNPTKCQNLL